MPTGLERFGQDIDLHGHFCGVDLGTGTGGHDLDRVTLAAVAGFEEKGEHQKTERETPSDGSPPPFFNVWILHFPEKFRSR